MGQGVMGAPWNRAPPPVTRVEVVEGKASTESSKSGGGDCGAMRGGVWEDNLGGLVVCGETTVGCHGGSWCGNPFVDTQLCVGSRLWSEPEAWEDCS